MTAKELNEWRRLRRARKRVLLAVPYLTPRAAVRGVE